MKRIDLAKSFKTAGRWLATAAICLSAIAFVWQGGFVMDTSALANPANNWIAAADLDDQVQNKVGQDARNTKGFVRDTAESVKETARNNANRVSNATDGDNLIQRKAQRDAGRIQQRANEDASRTQGAIDDTKNFVQNAVDNIKDAFD